MTQYIMWLKEDNIKVRAAYKETTKSASLPDGENIQDKPLESEDGLSYMVGSHRVTEKQLSELKADGAVAKTGDIKTRKDSPPAGWIEKARPE